MKVILDADVIADFYKDNRTGIFRVTYELFKVLSENNSIEAFYAHLSLFNYETTTNELNNFFDENSIKISAANHRGKRKFLPFRKEKLFRKLYKKLGVSHFANTNFKVFKEAEIFHSFYYPINKEVRKFPNLKNVVTIHDLIPILFPELHFTSSFIQEIIASIHKDDYVVCVSENTKKDLLKYAPHLNPNHVFVNLLAASKSLFYVCENAEKFKGIKEKYHLPDKYFLSVGTLEPRKNVDFVIRNFLEFVRENKIDDLSLVLVGAKGWDYDKIFEQYNNADELKDKIIITGRVPDEDLASLYSHAHSFYYMSLYEGFGLPPLEAMQCGVATVTSNISSLPEVVGDAGIMLDPKDGDSLRKVMLELYQNDSFRQEYTRKGLERSKLFSWEKSADNLIKIYEKITCS
ncbi:MAG: glycosyltransferase family 1 protein [Chryseobacterium sp.]|uniref:glycosyltransferase family 4 protein n=1 Tax=Chryseobacterium sp. TaxID=1871047 RepID=UPI000DB31CCB|nr:glycosyltransferase family 1 protein [Chryseobacterium sp.]MPS66459.1 glycosyltransferase family 1 protein [Chryseobacterium sp.]PZU15843.1 MAG: glycosyltransferase family 1 protein [Chryseobacterium sp.]